MHELSLCQSLMNIIQDQMTGTPYRHVKAICLEMGVLSHIDESALRLAFDVASRGTMAENARLDIIVLPGQAVCSSCQKTTRHERLLDPCEHCGQFTLTITQGNELRVKSMEVE